MAETGKMNSQPSTSYSTSIHRMALSAIILTLKTTSGLIETGNGNRFGRHFGEKNVFWHFLGFLLPVVWEFLGILMATSNSPPGACFDVVEILSITTSGPKLWGSHFRAIVAYA